MIKLRYYQKSAANKTIAKWHEGIYRVCLVMPTGSGKSVTAAEVVRRARLSGASVLALCHRRELVEQLMGHFGPEASAICPGFEKNLSKPIQVATIQTLLASGMRPKAQLVVADECHHLASGGDWQALAEDYSNVRTLGLTATPERGDGRPLGDAFDEIVVGATYSQLLADGHIVPCEVYQSPKAMGSNEMAQLPVNAIRKHGKGQMFIFCRNVKEAYEECRLYNSVFGEGWSEVIEGNTPSKERKDIIERFKNGTTTAIVNVYTMTEGIDVPQATTCVLARSASASTYLQMVGRVLRPSPGKEHAVLIDLCGASLVHGLPTEDREYSLEGSAISKSSRNIGVRVCLFCGYTYQTGPRVCPSCGKAPPQEENPIKIHSVELQKVFAGKETPDNAKYRELDRLLALGVGLDFVIKEYKKLFSEPVPVWRVPKQLRFDWYRSLIGVARKNGWKSTYALARYKTAFGCWPEWR